MQKYILASQDDFVIQTNISKWGWGLGIFLKGKVPKFVTFYKI